VPSQSLSPAPGGLDPTISRLAIHGRGLPHVASEAPPTSPYWSHRYCGASGAQSGLTGHASRHANRATKFTCRRPRGRSILTSGAACRSTHPQKPTCSARRPEVFSRRSLAAPAASNSPQLHQSVYSLLAGLRVPERLSRAMNLGAWTEVPERNCRRGGHGRLPDRLHGRRPRRRGRAVTRRTGGRPFATHAPSEGSDQATRTSPTGTPLRQHGRPSCPRLRTARPRECHVVVVTSGRPPVATTVPRRRHPRPRT